MNEGATLEISYIGYKTQTMTVRPQLGQIVMKEDTEVLDEVVVTALGIKRSQKALSYNVQEVKGDALTAVKDANFMNSLAGKLLVYKSVAVQLVPVVLLVSLCVV